MPLHCYDRYNSSSIFSKIVEIIKLQFYGITNGAVCANSLSISRPSAIRLSIHTHIIDLRHVLLMISDVIMTALLH